MSAPFAEAVAFALAHPSRWPLDLRAVIEGGTFDPPPWNVVLGPVTHRGGPAGLIAHEGEVVAHWGDTARADMVFSVTKSYIALLAAHALDAGVVADLDAPVSRTIANPAFASARNRQATWRQLLQQTSEWEGNLWGIPDSVDRDRQLAPKDDPARFGRATPLRAPGTYWDYNDARVNALCLALTLAFGRPLGAVLDEVLPVATPGRVWHGYGAASTLPDGTISVVGGGHWGGGLWCSAAHDLALGEVVRERGRVGGRQAISAAALDALLAPCALQPVYGALWWLNNGRALVPAAPESSVFATGVGMNAVWADPDLNLVAIAHWIDEPAFGGFVERVMAAL